MLTPTRNSISEEPIQGLGEVLGQRSPAQVVQLVRLIPGAYEHPLGLLDAFYLLPANKQPSHGISFIYLFIYF